MAEKIDLIIENVKFFFAKRKQAREEKRKYKIDRLKSYLPIKDCDYVDLAPESEITNGEEYLKALHWALKKENVKNIALAGPYGSGKSSIIQTYLKKHPSVKAINVSLASFDLQSEEPNLENKLEIGILKQLFYKISPQKIPQSRYRKITKRYARYYFIRILSFIIFGIFVYAFFAPESMEKVKTQVIACGDFYKIGSLESYTLVVIMLVISVWILSCIMKWGMSHLQIKEINILDKAALGVDDDNESVFDKLLDEIVYFFETTDYNIVFIEDLDRFNSTEIFVRLRELNTILNNYELIKRRIVFVYAVRDDM